MSRKKSPAPAPAPVDVAALVSRALADVAAELALEFHRGDRSGMVYIGDLAEAFSRASIRVYDLANQEGGRR